MNSITESASTSPQRTILYSWLMIATCLVAMALRFFWGINIWMLWLAGYFLYFTITLIRLIIRHSKTAAHSPLRWPRPVLLLSGTLAVVTSQLALAQLCQASGNSWIISTFEKIYPVFLGPFVLGAILTLCILALIEAGGINPLIDQTLQATMGSRTYREIHAEHHPKQATPSETQAPTQEEVAAAQSNR